MGTSSIISPQIMNRTCAIYNPQGILDGRGTQSIIWAAIMDECVIHNIHSSIIRDSAHAIADFSLSIIWEIMEGLLMQNILQIIHSAHIISVLFLCIPQCYFSAPSQSSLFNIPLLPILVKNFFNGQV